MERIPEKRKEKKSQHRKLTLENKILPPLLPGLELPTFRSRVRPSSIKPFPLPKCIPNLPLQKRHASSWLPPPSPPHPHFCGGIACIVPFSSKVVVYCHTVVGQSVACRGEPIWPSVTTLGFFLFKQNVVCGQCLVTLSLTINETLNRLSSLPILMQKIILVVTV